MSNKIEINFDSTSLGASHCELRFDRMVRGGYRDLMGASAAYGIGMHKFIDTMYKTGGDYGLARRDGIKAFNMPKNPPPRNQPHLLEEKHFGTSCFNLWTDYVEKDSTFDVLTVPVKCYWCKGTGNDFNNMPNRCEYCKGNGIVNGPATELTFRIKFYEDDFLIMWLNGTIDKVGQFKGGCYAIGDWKTTSAGDAEKYLEQYELNRQLRVYTLACKRMAKEQPDSILGRIGATKMGAFIDGVFIKPKANDNSYMRSRVYQFSDDDLNAFENSIIFWCAKYSISLRNNHFVKQGLLNGTCDGKYRCPFWNVCKNPDNIGQMILKKDFVQRNYNPLNFGGE